MQPLVELRHQLRLGVHDRRTPADDRQHGAADPQVVLGIHGCNRTVSCHLSRLLGNPYGVAACPTRHPRGWWCRAEADAARPGRDGPDLSGEAPDADELGEAYAAVLAGYVRHLSLQRNLSEHTVRAYQGDVAGMLIHLRRLGLASLDKATLGSVRSWLAKQGSLGQSRATLQRRAAAVRSFFRWAHQTGIISGRPGCKPPLAANRTQTATDAGAGRGCRDDGRRARGCRRVGRAAGAP